MKIICLYKCGKFTKAIDVLTDNIKQITFWFIIMFKVMVMPEKHFFLHILKQVRTLKYLIK